MGRKLTENVPKVDRKWAENGPGMGRMVSSQKRVVGLKFAELDRKLTERYLTDGTVPGRVTFVFLLDQHFPFPRPGLGREFVLLRGNYRKQSNSVTKHTKNK